MEADGTLLARRIKVEEIYEEDREGGKTTGIVEVRPLSPTKAGAWTIAGADFFHDCMDALLAAHIEGLRAVGGLYVVHDLRTLRSYERGARSHFVERMRARRALGAYLAGSFASVHDDPFLRLAAQGVNLASSLAGNGPVHLVRDPADARWPARGA